jgi:predicted membrane protein
LARLVSLLLGLALAAALMLLPAMRGRELAHTGHALLPILLLVVSALFVHGLGYRPDHRALRRLLQPWLLWPVAIGTWLAWWMVS